MKKDLGKISKPLLLMIAVIGLVISIELCVVYFNVNFTQDSSPSFCSINEVIDCDAVSETPYSRFLGVPLSVWGLGFYTFILFILLFSFHKFDLFKEFKHPKSYVFALSTLSVIVSIIMAFISSFVIQKICILCHALYLVNLLLFLVCLAGHSIHDLWRNIMMDFKNIFSDKKWIVISIISALAGIIFLVLINIYQPFVPKIAEKPEISKPDVYNHGYTIGQIGNTLGSEQAKLVIKEFTDYECPYCAVSHKMMLQITTEIPQIRVEHYDFPLNAECNTLIKNSIHKYGCISSYYARAAKKQGKFWDLATLLFENQNNLSEENILKLAESIGLDIEQLKKDAYDPELKKEIEENVQRAKSLGVMGTPSYIIGIKKYDGMMPYEELKSKITESL
ncbi:MAG: hypothetical protein A2Y25_01720 [Candidatus Melainabacteria bacterium GWF2_37_15]|nr:MAG: hypothetical protein A2Y25_01720 [Candidatus Melainabacteria bacterium GWF2_37_15]